MRFVHVAEETGEPIVWGWTFWLPPTEGHDHAVFMSGYDRQQCEENPTCGNGMTVFENIFDRLHRYWDAGVPLYTSTAPVYDTCGCLPCGRLEMLAHAAVAKHEGRMDTYHRILEDLAA